MLRRALSNLLSNAIRYTPPGEQVVVDIRGGLHGTTVDVVNNTGPSIDAQMIPRLFDRSFGQTSRANSWTPMERAWACPSPRRCSCAPGTDFREFGGWQDLFFDVFPQCTEHWQAPHDRCMTLWKLSDCWKADPSSTYNTWFLWISGSRTSAPFAEALRKWWRHPGRNVWQRLPRLLAGDNRRVRGGAARRSSRVRTTLSSGNPSCGFRISTRMRATSSPSQIFFTLAITATAQKTWWPPYSALMQLASKAWAQQSPTCCISSTQRWSLLQHAIVNGFNAVTGGRVKLGRWEHYLSMREGLLRLNAQYRLKLSNDLGAIAGLMFDIGSGRYAAPPQAMDAAATALWQEDLERVRQESTALQRELSQATESDATHTVSRPRCATWARRSDLRSGSRPTTGAAPMAGGCWDGWMHGAVARQPGPRTGVRATDRCCMG